MADRWDSKKDPVVGAGPGSGLHRTKSGRLINDSGLYLTPKETKGWDKVAPQVNVIRDSKAKVDASMGGIRIPGVPHVFTSRDSLVKFLKNSKGYVEKQKGWLNAHHKQALNDAGFQVKNAKVVKYVKPKATKPAPAAADRTTSTTGTAGASTDTSGYAAPTVDTSALDKLDPNTQSMISQALANQGGKLLDRGAADSMAGLQYDGQIQSLNDSIAKNPLDTAQHQKDIGSWYDQVLGALKVASGRDTAIQQAGVNEVGDNTKALVSAIGGSANDGSAQVAQEGLRAQGTLGALGVAQDQYNADLAPILQAEAAAQKTREGARGSGKLHDLQIAVATALGQRGQAKAANQLQIDQANNSVLDNRATRLIDILKSNNQSAQGNFSNAYGIASTKAGLEATGAKIASDITQNVNDNIGKVTVAQTRAGAKSATARPKFSSPQGLRMQKDAYANYTTWLMNNKDALAKMPTNARMVAAGNYLNKTYGWSQRINPDVANFVQTGLRSAKLY
jgi:hypothetical protein